MGKAPKTNVGESLAAILAERETTQTTLARALRQSPAYVNQIVTGAKNASPEWLDLVADAMALPKDQRRDLHIAGARDHGFKLDLNDLSEE